MKLNKQQLLKKILNSEEFKNSLKYQNLLEYLFTTTIHGEVPKELTIAHEVFGIDVNEKDDRNIRVYIYNLRKKLASYYIKEGMNDEIQFTIPKGRYKIEFIEKKRIYLVKYKKALLGIYLLAALVLASLIYLFTLKRELKNIKHTTVKSEYIWNDFMNNGLPTLFVMGDYYLLKDLRDSSTIRFLRDVRINSDEDYLLMEKDNKLERSKLTMLGKYAPVCVDNISKFFFASNINYKIILGSEFSWNDMQNSNLVFIGTFKTLGKFNELLKNSNFSYSIHPNELLFKDLESASDFHYRAHDSDKNSAYETDYSILVKLTSSYNSSIIFILSSRDIGLMATTKLIIDPDRLSRFEDTLKSRLDNPGNFEACFKVQGLYRNVIGFDLVNINPIKTSTSVEIE